MKIKPTIINGCGDSLWGKSLGEFTVNRMEFNDFCDTEQPYELQLFGPKTKWQHYTDSQICAEVNEKLLQIVKDKYPKYTVEYITWSEQGMQPDKGWSFDIIIEEELV
jgi:hypothetical protein